MFTLTKTAVNVKKGHELVDIFDSYFLVSNSRKFYLYVLSKLEIKWDEFFVHQTCKNRSGTYNDVGNTCIIYRATTSFKTLELKLELIVKSEKMSRLANGAKRYQKHIRAFTSCVQCLLTKTRAPQNFRVNF